MEAFLKNKLKDEPDNEGRTALMWAAGKGADKVIRKFIRHSVDMNSTDKNGGTGISFIILFQNLPKLF